MQDNMDICRLCLASEGKLFLMNNSSLHPAFVHLVGALHHAEHNLPQSLCLQCGAQLLSFYRLKQKSVKSQQILEDLLRRYGRITKQNISLTDRHELKSSLIQKSFDVNHYDYYFDHDSGLKYTQPIPDFNIEEIKTEIEDEKSIFVDEAPVFNVDTVLNEFDNKSDSFSNKDQDFIPTDNDSNSSADIPINQLKLKKIKRKKTVKKTKVNKKNKSIKESSEPKIDRRRKPFLNGDLNEALFSITNLTVEEQIADIEKRQESSNYKNAVFKCTECFKGFLDEGAYNSHLFRHSNECGEHCCDICKTRFKKSHALRKHITAHHTQRFSCNNCDFVTTHRQMARLHVKWHKGTTYQCPHCADVFNKFTTYMGHIRIKHPSDFVCELCGYSFVSAKGIEIHKKLKHRLDREDDVTPLEGPRCSPCDVRFVSEEAYHKHLQVSARHKEGKNSEIKHSNVAKKQRKQRDTKSPKDRASKEIKTMDCLSEKKNYPSQMRKAEGPIPCEQCDMQLEDSRAYHSHFRKVHPDKNRTNYPSMKAPCMCEVCGRMFQSYALLKDHRWVHTGELPFKCEVCSKSFRMKQRLVAHRRVHSRERASYSCHVCHKHFSTQSNRQRHVFSFRMKQRLVAHRRVHSRERASYSCHVCHKHFSTQSNRQRHVFIHTGLKPFKCELCGKSFKHASEKRAHHTYVHLKKPWPKRARRKDITNASASEMDRSNVDSWPPQYTSV